MLNLSRPQNRRALSEFVRDRRGRTKPEDVGLTAGTRRRTPGLRREEVAQLAGVGITWYTWFEQGRDIQVSAHFLERVSQALRLDVDERAHLYALAQHRPPPRETANIPIVSAALQAMLNSLPNPAYIKTSRWDVAAWNAAAAALLGDYAQIPPAERNTIWLAFTNPHYRRMMIDWEEDARRVLAKFRLDYGRAGSNPAFEELIEKLNQASPEFRRWWPRQDISGRGEGVKRLWHEKLGEIEFEHTAFIVEGAPDLRLVIYTPISDDDARRIAELTASG